MTTKLEAGLMVTAKAPAPMYWRTVVGKIEGIVRTQGKKPVFRIAFRYKADGTPLLNAEYMEFTEDKIKPVKCFLAKRKKAEAPPPPPEVDEYEEVIPVKLTETEEFKKWFKASVVRHADGSPRLLYCMPFKDQIILFTTEVEGSLPCHLRSVQPKKFAVGPLFDPLDSPINWLSEAIAGGNDCLHVVAHAAGKEFFYIPFNKFEDQVKCL